MASGNFNFTVDVSAGPILIKVLDVVNFVLDISREIENPEKRKEIEIRANNLVEEIVTLMSTSDNQPSA